MALATPIIACAYGEIALKGRNRGIFLRKLINNIHTALKGEPMISVNHVESRLLVHLEDASRAPEVAAKLKNVFGLQWISPVVAVPRDEVDPELREDLEAGIEPRLTRVSEVACTLAAETRQGARNFKIETRRSDRKFGLTSPQVSRAVGHAVQTETGLPAKMVGPDLLVNVVVLKENVLVFSEKIPAYGGLPFASSGRTMVLLSGGIDSPVAAWLMMRRGSRPEFVHFYSGRNLEEADVEKIKELAGILARYSPVPLVLHLVPVAPYEMRAIGVVEDRYDMVMFRRFMVKTAARLARRNSCLGLVTGDSLGQVASQTMYNLGAISSDVELPILRPLIGMDKMEITAWSKVIGAYETSILPYRDCCSIRSPRPILNARAEDLLIYSEKMLLHEAVTEAVENTVRIKVSAC
ncbi:MAG: tRNA uracil 4-sulfurtransferase ThiI [Candidatus Krumholzibacteria bacterium]|nr:tRNA uracil 4-sulfurtransferase ThiI [Candidatus Krumholzibacteria bacterium]